jgi:hypothetical protein
MIVMEGLVVCTIGFTIDNTDSLYTLVDTHGVVTRISCIRLLRILAKDP